MNADDETLAVAATATTELEGQLLANILIERGIRAVATGGSTSEFRASSPGTVQVMVKQGDLSAAQAALAQRVQQRTSSESDDAEDADDACAPHQSGLTKFGITSLLIGESLATAGIMAYLAMGGDVIIGAVLLVMSAGIVAAILLRVQFKEAQGN